MLGFPHSCTCVPPTCTTIGKATADGNTFPWSSPCSEFGPSSPGRWQSVPEPPTATHHQGAAFCLCPWKLLTPAGTYPQCLASGLWPKLGLRAMMANRIVWCFGGWLITVIKPKSICWSTLTLTLGCWLERFRDTAWLQNNKPRHSVANPKCSKEFDPKLGSVSRQWSSLCEAAASTLLWLLWCLMTDWQPGQLECNSNVFKSSGMRPSSRLRFKSF